MLLNFSEVIVGGFLTKDATEIKTENYSVCKTTVAINYQSIPSKKIKKDVVFIEVIFNNKNTKVASTLKKGDYVMLKTQIKQKIYSKDNYNFVKTYLVVDKILNITRKNNRFNKEKINQ